ncbi:hypothetical protein LT493_23180 [Streptomyces tricolor]|nr:hypothetical protein [Streptomyces tricolor]
MSEAGTVPVADRAAAALARTDGFSVPVQTRGLHGRTRPGTGRLTGELEALLAELTDTEAVRRRPPRWRPGSDGAGPYGSLLEGRQADRERALALLLEAVGRT